MENEKQVEIDLLILWSIFVKNFKAIIAITILTTVLGFVLSNYIIDPKYTAKTKVIVQMNYDTENAAQELNAISAAQKMIENCKIIFTSDAVTLELVDRLENQLNEEQLKNMISISSENQTNFFYVSVTSKSPELSATIANLLTEIGTTQSENVLKNSTISTLDNARIPEESSSPSVRNYTLIGFAMGLFASFFAFVVIELLDNKVKGMDDLSSLYQIPLLADIPDLNAKTKENYRYAKES